LLQKLKNTFWKLFTKFDGLLKFPNLKKGDIGIQLGFDMSSSITSDLFTMYKQVSPNGKIIGIDPDPFNHKIAQQIIDRKKCNILLINKATFSKKTTCQFLIGEKSSWNQLAIIPKDTTVNFTKNKHTVKLDTLDNILANLSIDINKITHINITVNGAEYDTLLGMDKILSETTNLSLTVIAGRHDESGEVYGKPDYELILKLLDSYGFTTKFKRINELFWWGFIVKTLINRKWVYGQANFGVVIASKGHKIKWYQSFS